MDPGDLNYRIVLQSRRSEPSGAGGEVVTWVDEFVCWAAAIPLSGRELIAAQQRHAETTVRFRIRFNTQVTSQWRIVWEGKSYDVLDVVDVGGQHWEMDLDCSTGLRRG